MVIESGFRPTQCPIVYHSLGLQLSLGSGDVKTFIKNVMNVVNVINNVINVVNNVINNVQILQEFPRLRAQMSIFLLGMTLLTRRHSSRMCTARLPTVPF